MARPKHFNHIICKLAKLSVALVLAWACLPVSALAGNVVFFEATGDYGGELPFAEETVACPVPDAVDETWLALDDVCGLLPLSYRVDGQFITIVNEEALAEGSLRAMRRYKLDGTWSDMLCREGEKIYVCPRLVNMVLDEQGLELGDGTVYYYRPDADYSTSYVINNGNDKLTEQVDRALYALWKNAESDYRFTVKTIGKIRQDDADSGYSYAVAYVWPGRDTCYIVKRNLPALKLAAVLAHEARHIAFCREWRASAASGDYYAASEAAAQSYQALVSARLARVK